MQESGDLSRHAAMVHLNGPGQTSGRGKGRRGPGFKQHVRCFPRRPGNKNNAVAGRGAKRDRACEVDSSLGQSAHAQHADSSTGLVRLQTARLGCAHPGVLLQRLQRSSRGTFCDAARSGHF